MGYLVGLLVVTVIVGLWLTRRWSRQQQIMRYRDQARLRVIEGQLASFQAVLRIQVAEHQTRQRMRDEAYEAESPSDRLHANGPWMQ